MLLQIKAASKEVSSRTDSAKLAQTLSISTARSALIVLSASNARTGILASTDSVSHVRIGLAGSVNLVPLEDARFVQKASLLAMGSVKSADLSSIAKINSATRQAVSSAKMATILTKGSVNRVVALLQDAQGVIRPIDASSVSVITCLWTVASANVVKKVAISILIRLQELVSVRRDTT